MPNQVYQAIKNHNNSDLKLFVAGSIIIIFIVKKQEL